MLNSYDIPNYFFINLYDTYNAAFSNGPIGDGRMWAEHGKSKERKEMRMADNNIEIVFVALAEIN